MPKLLLRLSVLLVVVALSACGLPSSPTTGKPGMLPHGGGLGRGGLPAPPDVSGLPDQFNGMASADVTQSLGVPDLRRRESPAEIWQYYGPGCVLDLFLYDDNGVKRVTHTDLRSRVPGQLPDAECLPKLLSGQRGGANS